MLGQVTATSFVDAGRTVQLTDEPDVCPRCHRSIQSKFRAAVYSSDLESVQVAFQCASKDCQELFIGTYRVKTRDAVRNHPTSYTLASTTPLAAKKAAIPEEVEKISPQFVEIYNQALSAESHGLDQVVGIGLRKSLEFLVKDYCAYENQASAEAIRSKFLANCIADHVTDANIKACAERATWLGNDEAHYVRKWSDHDIDDLKTLVKLAVNWVDSALLTRKYSEDMRR